MATKIGLDLGYANITLSDVTASVYREPSVALMEKNTHKIIAVGNSAETAQMQDAVLVRPFKNGLLYTIEHTRDVMEKAIGAVMAEDGIRCVIGIPSDYLPKQEKAIFNLLSEVGVKEAYAVKRSVAALIGAGYSPTMSAVSVNIGAAHTDIAVLHSGDIIYTSCESVGGEDFDVAVRRYILEQGDVNVSLSVARAIKERIGAVWDGKESDSVEIDGTLSLTGNRVKMSVASEDILGVFEEPLQRLLSAIANAVKKIPLDFVSDIFSNGIILSGGGAELFGLDKMIEKVLGVPVMLAPDPIDCVAKGLARVNAILPDKNRSNYKNITDKLSKFYETKKQKRKG